MNAWLPRDFCRMLPVVVLLAVSAAPADLSPQQAADLFAEAQQAYDRGIAALTSDPVQARNQFAEAAARFQLIADSQPPSGRLLYNLGNAYLQAGDLGRAILNYRRAEQRLPLDPRLQSNLSYARSLCRNQIEPSGSRDLLNALLWWHYRWPLRWRVAGFSIINALFWLTLAWWLVRGGAVVRVAGVALGLVWVTLAGSVAADTAGLGQRPHGVVLVDDVIVRKGNGVGFQPKFDQPLNAGVEFEVIESRGEWMNIRLANGEDGWIEATTAGLIH